eukprot:697332-Prorocentrum_minimum.AAC.1
MYHQSQVNLVTWCCGFYTSTHHTWSAASQEGVWRGSGGGLEGVWRGSGGGQEEDRRETGGDLSVKSRRP